ncbi:type II toxin-antitoxin system VapC family toxin [Candidatus Methylospira mobilis]|uniref:Type II toxin-antitoxin system VapC family toxin n=1 Tax=Candidatus Methylospira mobilis TaxID=1808979 RepID=A0A5Q0BF83_9GAMM|nr:type II toxin-antitoxin system VapC family toxin [Candidatus Methylospira mobilis]QFY41792.1 type II toxin-antitoxin system VapC family toxin [Candidatus Methylospira mobilis]
MNPRFCNNFIDANVLDYTGGVEDKAVDIILHMAEENAFTLLLPYSVKAEIEHTNTPAEVRRKASQLIYSVPVPLTPTELATHQKIRALVQGNAKPGKHDNDAFHIVESAKNGGGYFITNDMRLLKKTAEILNDIGIKVIKPSEFVALVN